MDEIDQIQPKRKGWKRFLPLMILALIYGLAKALDLDRHVSFEALSTYRDTLDAFVAQHMLAALAIYVSVLTIGVALSLPVPLYLGLAGGYLFGTWLGFVVTWPSANVGAIMLFLAARTALGDLLRKSAGPWMARFEAGVTENAFNHLLMLRLATVIPFWVVNLVPAFFQVKLRDYALATAIGTVPSTLILVSVGAGLREAFALNAKIDPVEAVFNILSSPPVLAALAGILLLALIPVLLKAFRKRPQVSEAIAKQRMIGIIAAPATPADFDRAYRFPLTFWGDIRIPPEIKTLVQKGSPGSVLELGCGVGRHSRYAAQQGLRATGVDFSAIAIAKAQQRVVQDRMPPHFAVGDVTHLDAVTGSFDISFDVGCFHCLDPVQHQGYVSQVRRLLKLGGTHLIWALDAAPSGATLSPEAVKEIFAPGFELTNARNSRRRIAASHWYWLARA